MPDITKTTQAFPIEDLSKGVQRTSTRFQQQPNELNVGENVSFGKVGGVGKKLGYFSNNSDLTSTTTTSTSTSTTTTSTSSSSSTSSSTSTTTTG